MKGNLLDTSVALLAVHHSSVLSHSIREAVRQGPNYLSVLSFWEVGLKVMKGKLLMDDPRRWWFDTQQGLKATALPLLGTHIAAIATLPAIHQDPFDRALIAQAAVENLVLVTTDEIIPQYRSVDLRTLS